MRARRWIVYADQMGPGGKNNGRLPLLRNTLGTAGRGRKSAWVRCPEGRFPHKPGYSRLHYDWIDNPHPWGMEQINIEATRLLQQSDSEPIGKRSRLLAADEWVLGYAWTIHDPGTLEDVVQISARHQDQIVDRIYHDWPDIFEVLPDASDRWLYLRGAYGLDGDGLRESLDGEPDLTAAEIEDMVESYRIFPVEAILRWR